MSQGKLRSLKFVLTALIVWAVLSFGTAQAWAVDFSVTPVVAVLSRTNRSQLLTLRNSGHETLRFQLSVSAWEETPGGEMGLRPTEDVVFFPQLLSLAPGESRKIRLGSLVSAEVTEKTYRLFIRQLKPLETSQSISTGGSAAGVQIITTIGVPVFIQPAAASFRGEVDGMAMSSGVLSFRIRNTGNIHFVVQKMRVQGFGDKGQPVFSREANGWYVLAGGVRDYQLPPLPADECLKTRSVSIQVTTERGVFNKSSDLGAGACAIR